MGKSLELELGAAIGQFHQLEGLKGAQGWFPKGIWKCYYQNKGAKAIKVCSTVVHLGVHQNLQKGLLTHRLPGFTPTRSASIGLGWAQECASS